MKSKSVSIRSFQDIPEQLEEKFVRVKATAWDDDIRELEAFFKDRELPVGRFRLNKWTMITDCRLFVEANMATVIRNRGNDTFLGSLQRLKAFKELLTNQEKGEK
jgi:hypothetical protein